MHDQWALISMWVIIAALAVAVGGPIGEAFGQGGERDGGPEATNDRCADRGVELIHTEIRDVGTQTCPAVSIGPGIPFVGQLKIFGIGSKNCPVLQEQTPAHHAPVEKAGFWAEEVDSSPIQIRFVSCSSAENLLVIGTSGCEYGEWMDTLTQVKDWDEHLCEERG